ncbi:MAG: hypothetical protein MUF83_08225 [Acidimicrobiales bacterium]|jgi:hypothetical protein|nr:hypothetical protein [Acidimicrobiales bacterium]
MFVYGGTVVPDGPEVPGIRVISASDPAFDVDAFLEQARAAHGVVHAAVVARKGSTAGDASTRAAHTGATADTDDLGDVADLLTGGARRDIAGFVGRTGWRSPVERYDHEVVIDASHGATDVITVRFGVHVDGRDRVDDWTFERRAATETVRGDDGQLHRHLGSGPVADRLVEAGSFGCGSCGAALALEETDTCRYCGAALPGRPGPWRVSAIRPPRRIEPVPTPGPLVALGEDIPVDELVRFAQSVYQRVHLATAGGDLAAVEGVLTARMRDHLAGDPDDLAWDQHIRTLVEATVVDVQRGALDVVTIRFVATIDSGDIAEDWVFERPAPADPAAARPPTRCPVCGAAIDLDEDGDCRHCSTHLRGVAGDWRVANAYRPDTLVTHPVVIDLLQSRAGQRLLVLVLVAVVALSVVAVLWLVGRV